VGKARGLGQQQRAQVRRVCDSASGLCKGVDAARGAVLLQSHAVGNARELGQQQHAQVRRLLTAYGCMVGCC
jgi:hypothetical protein